MFYPVTNFHTEGRGDVRGGVAMALFISVILLDQVDVIPSDNHGMFHFARLHFAG